MKKRILQFGFRKTALTLSLLFTSLAASAQTNVYDDVIATSPNHTSLKAALDQEGLDVVLQNSMATLTVFAPDNIAFENLATELNTDIAGLLALSNLSEILQYHVLGVTVDAAAVTNGAIVDPLNTANTIKMTKKLTGEVYANQALVTGPDNSTDNGIVHIVDAVILPNETVVDIAIDNGFTSLTTAVITAELLPALTNPFAELTVFAPDDNAFDDLAAALNTDINGLLALANLQDILLYHVLGSSVDAAAVVNGAIVDPLSSTNTIKMTKKSNGEVYANQAMVTGADNVADNGIVHIIDAVILPYETVVDVAIDNAFTSLTEAVVTAELLPALTDPLGALTVFAPDNDAFNDLATALNTDLAGVLASPILTDILLYHVVDGTVLSSALTNGPVATLNGEDVQVDLSNGVMINTSTVTLADLEVDNGVVHVIDAVLLPSVAGIEEMENEKLIIAPNPVSNGLNLINAQQGKYEVSNLLGRIVLSGDLENGIIDVSKLSTGNYIISVQNSKGVFQSQFTKL